MKYFKLIFNKKYYERFHGGFLLPEIMISFSLMTVFLISAIILSSTMQGLRRQAVEHLERLDDTTFLADYFLLNKVFASSSISYMKKQYGNDTYEIDIEPVTLLISDYINAFGRDSCSPSLFSSSSTPSDFQDISLYSQGVDIGAGNMSTDIEVRNGIAYITADSSSSSASDFFIIDSTDPSSPSIISSLNTGPGLSSIEIAGHYAYVTNISSLNQLQIINIKDRTSPSITAILKLPLPPDFSPASSTPPFASSIFYNKRLIYLGTSKWDGMEFSIIDVSIPSSPQYLGGFETNTLINNIYVRDGLAYLATSDINQIRILDIHNISSHDSPSDNSQSIIQVSSFSPSGYETQQGKVISFFENKFSLGRTTGGFNNKNNYEIFLFSSTSPITVENSKDIPGGVYGIVMRPPYFYISTRASTKQFQILNKDMSELVLEKNLGFSPQAMTCDGKTFYFATGDQKGIAVVKIE